jgi:protein-S-isoprenylcysteine O-methyltransferase Ste14
MALAWGIAYLTPEFIYLFAARIPLTVMLMLVGVSLALSGVFTFREAKTTLNPHTPEASTQMVNSGPFRFTRNPMYLGLVLLLLGVCVYLANPLTLIAVAALVTYLTRFQVLPEERRLLERFGEQYACYARTVRRWI